MFFCQTVGSQTLVFFLVASKDDSTNECFSYLVNFMYMVAIHFQGMPPLGGREGSPLSCGLAFSLFESHGCVIVPLAWDPDPDRYDFISEYRLFLCSWTVGIIQILLR